MGDLAIRKNRHICTGCGESKPLSEISPGWPQRCKDCVREYQRKYYKKHPGKRAGYDRSRWQEKRDSGIEELGGKCSCCGESEVAFLRVLEKEVWCFNCSQAVKRLGACPHRVLLVTSTKRVRKGSSSRRKDISSVLSREMEAGVGCEAV